MQITPAMGVSIVAAAISVGAVALARHHWRTPGIPALAGFNVAVAIWTAGNAAQISATTLETKLFWINFQYIGIAALPITVFVFATIISGHDEWLTRKHLGLLTAPLVAMVGLSWTNSMHGLVRETATLAVVNGTVVIERTFGPAFWGSWIYTNLLLLIATILILRAVVAVDVFVRRRTAALLIGAAVPWLAHLLFLVGVSPVEPEPFFAVTGVAFVYAMSRYEQIDSTPPRRERVIEAIDEGILGISEANQVVDLNSAARRILDLHGESVLGEPSESVLDTHPGLLDWYQGDQEEAVVSVQTEARTHHLSVGLTRIENELGGDTDILVLKDITDRKEKEEELKWQYDRLDEFTSVLSHDLRNPLNVAQGHVDLARETGDLDHLEAVEQAHNRMTELIDDVLYLARTDRDVDENQPVDLADICTTCWGNVETPNASFVLDTDKTVLADESRLIQMLENLIRNAVEHGGQNVTVTVGSIKRGFYVEDDGNGIPEAEREHIFETGYSSSPDGTGLGLSIVKRIVDAHDWEITVTEGSKGGTRFEITGVESADE